MRFSKVAITLLMLVYLGALIYLIIRLYGTAEQEKNAVKMIAFNTRYCGCIYCPILIDNSLTLPTSFGSKYDKEVARYCADLLARLDNSLPNNPTAPSCVPKQAEKIVDPSGLTRVTDLHNDVSDNNPTFGAVWQSTDKGGNNIAWIGFRGTSSDLELYQDFAFAQTNYSKGDIHKQRAIFVHGTEAKHLMDVSGGSAPQVHSGFSELYGYMKKDIYAALEKIKPKTVIISGHSLGAAASTIAGVDLAGLGYSCLVYNFASPLVGDTMFANLVTSLKLPVFRHVNTSDVIPTVPYSVCPNYSKPDNPYFYTHCGTALYYTDNRFSLENNHSMGNYINAFVQGSYKLC